MEKMTVALVGSPNSGKTSLFNALTGSNQRVGNYPGITVEKKKGMICGGDHRYQVIDLPGLYSLDTRTLDERVTKRCLLGELKGEDQPNLILSVVDSTNLKRSMYLTMELRRLGLPIIVVLNIFDLAQKRGLKIDTKVMEQELGAPVVIASSNKIEGVGALKELVSRELEKLVDKDRSPKEIHLEKLRDLSDIQQNFKKIDEVLEKAIITDLEPDSFTDKVDKIILHPVWGMLIMLASLLFMFQLVFTWAAPLTELIEYGLEMLASWIGGMLPEHGIWKSLVIDGLIAGVGGVVVFLPQILLLFFVIMLMEDFGYLGRVAFLLDHFMRRLGLPGKAVVPLLSSHACAVPGIMAARTINNERDRLTTMLVAPLTACSARIPVYTLLIAAIIPSDYHVGPLSGQALAFFFLYTLGIVSSFVVAFILKRTILTGNPSGLLLELPSYRLPRFSYIFKGLWSRIKLFLQKVGKIVIMLSLVVWFLVSFPRESMDKASSLETSYAAMIGKSVSPIFEPLGFDWKLTTALIPSFGAREIVVSTMATVLAVEESENDKEFEANISKVVKSKYSLATLLSLIIWFVFAPQCLSTFAIFKKESGSWAWTAFMGAYTLGLAYLGSLITYQIFQ